MKSPLRLVAGLIVTASTAAAQSLPWSIVTTTTDSGAVLGHDRPIGLLPHTASPALSATTRHTTRITYDVTLTNSTASTQQGHVRLATQTRWLVANCASVQGCWGYDGGMPDSFDVVRDVTIHPGQVLQFSGVAQYFPPTLSYVVPHPAVNVNCNTDCMHIPSGATSVIHVGPTGFSSVSFLNTGGTGGFVNVVDNGTFFTNEVEITSDYLLPPLANSTGCGSANVNSTGALGALGAFGVSGADGLVVLSASDLPSRAFGFVLLSTNGQAPASMPGGQGSLCLAMPVVRWLDTIAQITNAGSFERQVPIGSTIGPLTVTTGSTLHFQLWHRDVAAGSPTSNTTNSVAVTF